MSSPSSSFKAVERRRKRKPGHVPEPRPIKEIVDQAQNDLGREPWFLHYEAVLLSFIFSCPIRPQRILCLGLGSLVDSVPPRFQFCLLLDICRQLALAPGDIDLYDPAFNRPDIDYFNDAGLHVLTADQVDRPCIHRPTLLYMPHCDRQLYESVFSSNWSRNNLEKIVLLGNDLKTYVESIPSKKLQEESPLIVRIASHINSTELPPSFPLHVSAFNNLAFQYVMMDTLPPCDDSFWQPPKEAQS